MKATVTWSSTTKP